MVGSDDDEGLVGVLLVKFVGDSHAAVKLGRLEDGGRQVVGVRGMVDTGPFDHHEKSLFPFFAIELVDAGLYHKLQPHRFGFPVDNVGQPRARGGIGIEQKHLAGSPVGVVSVDTAAYGVALLAVVVVERGLRGCIRLLQGAAGQEIELAVGPFLADEVGLFTHLRSIEGCRGSVVDLSAGYEPYGIPFVAQLFGDRGERFFVGRDAYVVDVGLVSRGQSRGGSSRAGDEAVVGVGPDGRVYGKVEKGNRLVALLVVTVFVVELGSQYVGEAHAVAYAEKDVFGRFGRERCRAENEQGQGCQPFAGECFHV